MKLMVKIKKIKKNLKTFLFDKKQFLKIINLHLMSRLSSFFLLNLQSRKRFSPKFFLLVAFKNLAGIIWSVSIFSTGKGTADEINVFILFILFININNFPINSCCCCHQWTWKYCSWPWTLSSFKISIRCWNTYFTWRNFIVVHS